MTMKNIYRESNTETAVAVTHEMLTSMVGARKQRFINSFTMINHTTAASVCNTSISRLGVKHLLDTVTLTVAGRRYRSKPEYWLNAGEILGFDFTGVVVGDKLSVYLEGEEISED